jgi:hypothetical protein
MSNLFRFLTDLATDPKRQQMFAHNPGAVMEIAGLSEVEQTWLKSGDKAKVAANFANECQQLAVIVGDPGPDPLPDPDPPTPEPPSEEPPKDK